MPHLIYFGAIIAVVVVGRCKYKFYRHFKMCLMIINMVLWCVVLSCASIACQLRHVLGTAVAYGYVPFILCWCMVSMFEYVLREKKNVHAGEDDMNITEKTNNS